MPYKPKNYDGADDRRFKAFSASPSAIKLALERRDVDWCKHAASKSSFQYNHNKQKKHFYETGHNLPKTQKYVDKSNKIRCSLGDFDTQRDLAKFLDISESNLSMAIRKGKVESLCGIYANGIDFNGRHFKSIDEIAKYIGHNNTRELYAVLIYNKRSSENIMAFSGSHADIDGYKNIFGRDCDVNKDNGSRKNERHGSRAKPVTCLIGTFNSQRELAYLLDVSERTIKSLLEKGIIDNLCEIVNNGIEINGKIFKRLSDIVQYFGHRSSTSIILSLVYKMDKFKKIYAHPNSQAAKDGWIDIMEVLQ